MKEVYVNFESKPGLAVTTVFRVEWLRMKQHLRCTQCVQVGLGHRDPKELYQAKQEGICQCLCAKCCVRLRGGYKQSIAQSSICILKIWTRLYIHRLKCKMYKFHISHFYESICRINTQKWNYWVKKTCIIIFDRYCQITIYKGCSILQSLQQYMKRQLWESPPQKSWSQVFIW